MKKITTRLATMDDIDQLADMFDAYRQFYELAPDLALSRQFIYDRMLGSESVLIVAEDEAGAPAGFCQLYPSFCSLAAAPIYALYDLYVRPEARKLGAGRALLLAAEAHALRNGALRLDLTTAKTNLAAQSLYTALGWQRDDIFYAYSKTLAA
ncbi:GNAT family N-acetyltransferase [Massilia pseudoviolaceinigra]|uniref:GNAT family N-acetyltransferase n=1 Tax=Massilia pseudoviolaceinigra TaxID=3057165 RepID=UPI0027968111|nr:GNAT family N-acetyltransferase [Massilia sp. CCM 9206]MDQ1924040.1 GNAT family N-acetyltransferase [Massilia sp. CCM 9206]